MAVELLRTSEPILVSDVAADRLYRQLWRSLVTVSLLLALVVAWIELPEPLREEEEALPPQLARILLEEREIPPPPPKPEPKPEPEKPKPEPKPGPKPEVKPEPKPQPVKSPPQASTKPQPQPVASPKLQQSREQARQRAASAGVMAAEDDLAALRELADSDLGAGPLTDDASAVVGDALQVDRALLTAGVAAGSGGINSAAVSRTTGGASVAGRSTSSVQGSRAEQGRQQQATSRSSGGGNGGGRSEEEVRLVLERAKASLYTLYNRELRKNPLLKGKVMFELVIEPSGKVSSVKVVSSQLAAPELEKKLVARLKSLNFGSCDVARTTTKWAVAFLPQ